MTENAISWMSLAPILFLINGFWMLSNRQMFENVVNSMDYSDREMTSGHLLSTAGNLNQATPMLLICITLVVIHFGRTYFYETLSRLGYSITSTTIEVHENLPKFY